MLISQQIVKYIINYQLNLRKEFKKLKKKLIIMRNLFHKTNLKLVLKFAELYKKKKIFHLINIINFIKFVILLNFLIFNKIYELFHI